jgi:hypothetical protein
MPATLPDPGTFVATYTAQGVAEDPLNRRRTIFTFLAHFGLIEIKNPTVWVPQSTIVIMKLKANGGIEGKIQRNPAGTATPEFPPLPFNGVYQFALNEVLDVYEGLIHVNLLATRGEGPPQLLRTQVLYAVCQDADTIKFMLRESQVPDSGDSGSTVSTGETPGPLSSVPADAVVQGVLERVS